MRTRNPHALTAFAKVLPRDTNSMEVDICEDGSGSIAALTGNHRTIVLTFQMGMPDGMVYDYRLMNKPGYVVYEPPTVGRCPACGLLTTICLCQRVD